MTTPSCRLTVAQLAVVRLAAARKSRALAPLPAGLRGAAGQSIIDALVTRKYAVRCYLPTHVEYVLTDAGLDVASKIDG
jgi:hypothetical protein